eukprot:2367007-Prymnesium_polylepis.6
MTRRTVVAVDEPLRQAAVQRRHQAITPFIHRTIIGTSSNQRSKSWCVARCCLRHGSQPPISQSGQSGNQTVAGRIVPSAARLSTTHQAIRAIRQSDRGGSHFTVCGTAFDRSHAAAVKVTRHDQSVLLRLLEPRRHAGRVRQALDGGRVGR